MSSTLRARTDTEPVGSWGYRGSVPFHIALLILFAAGIGLIVLSLSGYGSSDRSNQQHPRLPGHDTQERLEQWERDHRTE